MKHICKFLVSLVLIFGFITSISATNQQYSDSLFAVWQLKKDDISQALPALNDFIRSQYKNGNIDTAKKYVEIQYSLAQENNNAFQEALALHTKGGISLKKGDLSQSIEFSQQAADIFHNLKKEKEFSNALNNIAVAEVRLGNFQKAIHLHDSALKIRKTLKDPDLISYSLTGLSSVYNEMGRSSEAIDYAMKALKIYENDQGSKEYASIQHLIGNVYFGQGDREKAIEHFKIAAKIYEDLSLIHISEPTRPY